MSEIETAVADHYTTGQLSERITGALQAIGLDPEKISSDDLKAGDEFHTGGLLATDHFLSHLTITRETRVLDVGSGIGGTSRHIADKFEAHVTGVDLTPEFVNVATELSERVGLGDRTNFHIGSALDMPVPDASFDLAVMMHVGMNIADKLRLFAEVSRALAPGGVFAVFDVAKGNIDEPLVFPLPWSTVPETSFLALPSDYAKAAEAAGMTQTLEHDRSDFAKAFFKEAFAKAAKDGPAPFGIHLMMGDTAPEKFRNYVANLDAGRLRPVEMIFKKTTR